MPLLNWRRVILTAVGCLLLAADWGRAAVLDFESYVAGASIVGVSDAALTGGGSWTVGLGTASGMVVSTSHPYAGAKALRITDGSSTSAMAVAVDTGTTIRNYGNSFTIGMRMSVSGTNATNGTQQVQVLFGKPSVNSWNGWMGADIDGNNVRVWVDNPVDGVGSRQYVVVGQVAAGSYCRLAATIDPVAKKYLCVTFNGADVTSKVRSINEGTIPWRSGTNELPGTQLWLVTGTNDVVTADFDDITIVEDAERWSAAASEEWLPYITATTSVLYSSGSALDFSGLAGLVNSSIDTNGQIRVGTNGEFIAIDGTPLRLLSAELYMPGFPISETGSSVDANLDAFVSQLVRGGYNCLRPHFLDEYLMKGSTADRVLNPDRFILWQKLVAKLRAKNIYLFFDVTTSWCSYYYVSTPFYTNPARLKRLKSKMYWDADTRNHWKLAAALLLNTPNSYNGNRTLAGDYQMLVAQTRNEAGLFFQLGADEGTDPLLKDEPGLADLWHKWLTQIQSYYSTIAQLNSAWGTAYASFNEVPFPDMSSTGEAHRDLQRFTIYIEQETSMWMQHTLRGLGVKCPILDYNNYGWPPTCLSRDVQDVTDLHTYHDHGFQPTDKTYSWYHDNTSAIDNSFMTFRDLAPSRHWGRPFTISEWGFVFWNEWRHEGGLAFPAYAAMQGWSMLGQHADPVVLAPAVTDVFEIRTDPPTRAAETMAALMFRRRDVKTSPHILEIQVDPNQSYSTSELSYPWCYKVASLLTRTGIRVNWPTLASDEFSDTSVATASQSSLPNVPASTFWNTNKNASSTVTCSGGRVVMTAEGGSYPSAGIQTRSSGDFDFWTKEMSFEISGIAFSATSSSVTAAQQILRMSLTTQGSAIAYGAARAIVVQLAGDNKIRVGYKLDAVNMDVIVANKVLDITDLPGPPAMVTGLTFTPLAVDINSTLTTSSPDMVFELCVRYKDANGHDGIRRYSERWGKNATYAVLTAASWGASTSFQLETQKINGTMSGTVTASVDRFSMLPAHRVPSLEVAPGAGGFTKTYSYPTVPYNLTLTDVVSDLKAVGILSADNVTVPVDVDPMYTGVYQNDTKEILLDSPKRIVAVSTARSEGITLQPLSTIAYPYTINNLTVVSNNPAPYKPNALTVFASVLDGGATLYDSQKILLILSADSLNSGQTFSDWKRNYAVAANKGSLPLLLKRSNVTLKFKNAQPADLKIFPLAPDGSRRPTAMITPTVVGDTLQATIDTGALADGKPAVYFEISPYVDPTPKAPSIQSQPLSAQTVVGGTATFSVTAIGMPAPTYQWQRLPASGGVWESVTDGASYSGSTTRMLTLNGVTKLMNGDQFACVVSNGTLPNATSSTAMLSVQTAYEQWAGNYFTASQLADASVSGADAMPQHDAVPNAVKLLCRIDPTVPLSTADRAALPTAMMQTVGQTPYLCLTYRQSSSATGVAIQLQSSVDLRSWQNIAPDVTEIAGIDAVTGDPITRLKVNCAGVGVRFIRLNVNVP